MAAVLRVVAAALLCAFALFFPPTAIASANDAASALAERLAGDEPAFVARMNDKARELGLTGTRFTNPHGLPDPIQRSNARDLATLTRRLIHDYPMSRPLLGGQTFV